MTTKQTRTPLVAVLRKAPLWLLVFTAATFLASSLAQPVVAEEEANRYSTYLPLISNGPPTVTRDKLPAVIGVIPSGYVGDQKVIDSELKALDNWAGKRMSLVGLFISIEDGNPSYNIPTQLEKLWTNGYAGFINMGTGRSAYDIASGALDGNLRNWARAYNEWAGKGDGRFAYLAPLQEMNGYWVSYKLDPANYKIAYDRIRDIFSQAGISSNEVRWVFAPNGWTRPGDPPISDYYPGDSKVDLVAFSAYNFGYCSINTWPTWESPDKVYSSSLQIMHEVAPSKPIIIAQTGTTANTRSGSNSAAKDQWLIDAYNYLVADPMVFGVIYFNLQKECDWPVYTPGGVRYDGYRTGISNEIYQYLGPGDLSKMPLSP